MSVKKRKTRAILIPALRLIEADAELMAIHTGLLGEGYQLVGQVRCYRRQDGTMTLQFNWNRRRPPHGSDSYTMTIKGL